VRTLFEEDLKKVIISSKIYFFTLFLIQNYILKRTPIHIYLNYIYYKPPFTDLRTKKSMPGNPDMLIISSNRVFYLVVSLKRATRLNSYSSKILSVVPRPSV